MHSNKSYRKLLTIVAAGCLLFGVRAACAQSLDNARESYKTFLAYHSNGAGNSEGCYDALLATYKAYAALIEQRMSISATEEGKNVLREIRPYMQHGAVFYSQRQTEQSQKQALIFARAYVDIPLMSIFREERFKQNDYYPTMVYFAASGCYNSREYSAAIRYFREYLTTGATDKKRDILLYMVNAYQQIDDMQHASRTLAEAIEMYPRDFELLSKAINVAIDTKDNDALQKYVERALEMRPDDRTLMNIQAKLYEDMGRYVDAVRCYTRLREDNPQSLNYAKHLALNYYNLGVLYNNMSMEQTDKKQEQAYAEKMTDCFSMAEPIVRDILNYDPNSLQYLNIKATIDWNFGRLDELAEDNRKITALGGQPFTDSDLPTLIAYDQPQTAPQPTSATSSSGQYAANSASENSGTGIVASQYDVWDDYEGIPPYSAYAKQYVESRINSWQKKDPYETLSEYRQRVSEETRRQKIEDLLLAAETNYIERYAPTVHLSDLKLRPYDAEHEVFLAESEYGEIIIPVPRANNEAKIFESSWKGVRLANPKYHVVNDKMLLAGLTFTTPTGKSYRYDGKDVQTYTETVDMHFDEIDYSSFAQNDNASQMAGRVKKTKVSVEKSDVDINIPQTGISNSKTFAIVIANENYEMVAGVPMALNDGKTFAAYCQQTLGLPKNNVRLYKDATYGSMLRAVRDIESIADAYNGDINVIFYYAGHGIPNETTRDAFLLPVDADGLQTEVCLSLNKLYGKLGQLNAESVIVFLDACFSGAQRDSDSRMLASARGIALRANKEAPSGNMVIFSAASGDETAFPYAEKGHGLFTYFLLKKLQETNGDVSLSELSSYVIEHVKQQSVVANRKPQTPNISASESLENRWGEMRLRPTLEQDMNLDRR